MAKKSPPVSEVREKQRGDNMPRKELTANQEQFCINLEIKKMSQRAAYRDAYPNNNYTDEALDVKACKLANSDKVKARRKELKNEQLKEIKQEAKWTRDDAHKNLTWLIEMAKEEIKEKGEMSSPLITAIVSSVKELNVIFAVGEKSDGGGVLEDILNAVRGIDND